MNFSKIIKHVAKRKDNKLASLINGTGHIKKQKQLFEYQQLILLRDTWLSKF
jgi:hypothetical protein